MPTPRLSVCCLLLLAVSGLPSCGLIRAPFRVVGAVADGTYRGGKKVANSMTERKKRKAAEKAKEEAEAERKKGQQTPPRAVPGMPPLPVDGQTDIMGDPIKPVPTIPPPAPLGTPLPPIEMPR